MYATLLADLLDMHFTGIFKGSLRVLVQTLVSGS